MGRVAELGSLYVAMKARLAGLYSVDLPSGPPAIPGDPEHCWIAVQADIGLEGSEGADTFTFYVTTPSFLRNDSTPIGRSTIVVDKFNWRDVESEIRNRCARAHGETWEEFARSIEGDWEFNGYTDATRDV